MIDQIDERMNSNNSDLKLNPAMAAASVFDSIVRQIQLSNLNFKLQLSPFAAEISLKKTPAKNKWGIPLPVPNDISFVTIPGDSDSDNSAALAAKNAELENELIDIKNKYTKAVEDSETANRIMKTMQEKAHIKPDPDNQNEALIKHLNEEIANLVKENEETKISNKNQKKEICDLEKIMRVKNEVSEKLNKELKELKVKFNKEKSEMIKCHKKEVKYWRKELGEETKVNIKLKEILENANNDKPSKPPSVKKKTEKIVQKSNDERKNSIQTCSICASKILNYNPEYFCGEIFNPACEMCKANDDTWNPDDPFSSFPTSCQPTSLVSHWLIPPENNPSKHPSSICSMISHHIPNQRAESDVYYIWKKQFLEIFEEYRTQLKADRAKILQEMKINTSWLN